MSEMIEIVAKAIAESDHNVWEDSSPRMQGAYRANARAAILAMEEPTAAMMDTAPASYSASFQAIWPKICGDIWRAMIRKAAES